MTDTYVLVGDIARVGLESGAPELASEMYARLLAELSDLDPAAWETVTVCAPWTVADIVRHLVGAAKGHASLRDFVRQAIHGARHKKDFGGNDMDAMNALQVADHLDLGPEQLVAELKAVAPRAVSRRMKRRRLTGKIRLPNAAGGSTAPGMPPSLTLGHLMTVILTRDVFLHRLDIARATGRDLVVDHVEAKLVADVVAEWADRHGKPFELTLSGPAGGRFGAGEGGTHLEMDAMEFCWVLSGRGEPVHDLLATRVLF